MGFHAIGAVMTGVPEIAIRPEEAMALAKAVSGLSVYYNLDLVGGKLGAWAAALATAGMVYGPKVKILMDKRKAAKRARAAAPSDPFEVQPGPLQGYDFSGLEGVN